MTVAEIGIALVCIGGASLSSYKVGVRQGVSVMFKGLYARTDTDGKVCIQFTDDGETMEVV